MINQRNYAYFSSQKCDCCKRVRQIKTKIEVLDDEGGLLGEMSLCPQCLRAFKGKALVPGPKVDQAAVDVAEVTEDLQVYDDEDLELDDYKKMGYNVQSLL